jgi:hypothetical protein
MQTIPLSKRKREEEVYYSNIAHAISPDPVEAVLRYEDAKVVFTDYVRWQFQLQDALQGYSKVQLVNVKGYNNYSSNRLSMIGINFDELGSIVKTGGSGGSTANAIGPTFCVPNDNYTTTAFTVFTWQAKRESSPTLSLGSRNTYSSLTVTLQDGVGSILTASGTPAGFFCDITLLFFN